MHNNRQGKCYALCSFLVEFLAEIRKIKIFSSIQYIYITIPTLTSIHPYISVGFGVPSQLQFLQSYHKKSQTKVSWSVLRVKHMHFGSPSDFWDPCGKEKPSYILYIIRQGEAELRILEFTQCFITLAVSVPSSCVH